MTVCKRRQGLHNLHAVWRTQGRLALRWLRQERQNVGQKMRMAKLDATRWPATAAVHAANLRADSNAQAL
jgi:hypothetical protein